MLFGVTRIRAARYGWTVAVCVSLTDALGRLDKLTDSLNSVDKLEVRERDMVRDGLFDTDTVAVAETVGDVVLVALKDEVDETVRLKLGEVVRVNDMETDTVGVGDTE